MTTLFVLSKDTDSAPRRKVALIRIHGKDFKLDALPLRTVRPMLVDEVCLQEELGVEKNTPEHIEKFLSRKVLFACRFFRGKQEACFEALHSQGGRSCPCCARLRRSTRSRAPAVARANHSSV